MKMKKNERMRRARSKRNTTVKEKQAQTAEAGEIIVEPVEGQNGLFTIRLISEEEDRVLSLSEITRVLTEPLKVETQKNERMNASQA